MKSPYASDPSAVFFKFGHRKVKENPSVLMERTFNIFKIAKFESDTSYASEHIAQHSWENSEVCTVGPSIQTSAKSSDFGELYLRWFSTNHFQN